MLRLHCFIALFFFFLNGPSVAEEADPISKLAWQIGPRDVAIGAQATLKIPKGYAFLDAANTKQFMELNQNISSGEQYILAPESLAWFAVFHFDPVGYVKDDEAVNADDILASVKRGTEQSNEERRRRGWSTLSIEGWRFPPQYDKQTKLLEWALLAKSGKDNSEVINYNTRLLGRNGVMEVVLVASPANLDAAIADLKHTLVGYDYAPGEKYAEFKKGDRVAEFGLAALIAGGAAAVAAKKGFFAVIATFFAAAWKFIAIAAVGAFAWIKSIFKRKNA